MRKRSTGLLLALLLLLCQGFAAAEVQQVYIPSLQASFPFEGQKVVEPASTLQPDDLHPAAYGFTSATLSPEPVATLLPGSFMETPLYRLDGPEPGPSVFLVGGTHGDERAGWYAALMLTRIQLKRGRLWLIPQANRPGCEAGTRQLKASQDLNRAYPGKVDGNEAERLAYAILTVVLEAEPDLLIDLHEAAFYGGSRAFLGQTLILGQIDGIEEPLFQLMAQMEEPGLWSRPFSLEGPGIPDSLNSAAAAKGLPVFTVETFRGYALEDRVEDQLRVVQHFLKGFDMIE